MKIHTFIKKYSSNLIMIFLILFLSVEFSNKFYNAKLNQNKDYVTDFKSMIGWIKNNTGQNDIILSEWELGTLITGYTGRKAIATSKVYPSEALLVSDRYKELSRFFFTQDENYAVQFLQKYNVSYILISNTMDLASCKYINSCSKDNWLYTKAFSGNPKVMEKSMIAKLLFKQKSDYFRLMTNTRNFKIYKVMKQNFYIPYKQQYLLDSGFYKFTATIKNHLDRETQNKYFDVKGAIVPHGFPYSLSQISDLFNSLGDNYTSIVLIGPDHQDVSYDFAVTSTKNWTTPFGELHSDLSAINKLGIQEDDFAMINDWSLRILLPFVKHKYPESKITPILVKSGQEKEKYMELGKEIANLSNTSTLILLSLDFSHIDNITNTNLNQKEDIRSLEIIKNLDLDKVGEMEIESSSAAYVFLSTMKAEKATNFTLLNLSSSIYAENGRGVGFITAVYSKEDSIK